MVEIAAEEQITPWDALLRAVRQSAARVAYVDHQLASIAGRDFDAAYADPEQDEKMRTWLAESRKERTLLARQAKAAIDGRVSEAVVRNIELEGQLMARVIGSVLDALPLDQDQRMQAWDVARRELLEAGTGDDPIR